MPIYEYECASCHHEFELLEKINDPKTKTCPHCFKDTATRLISRSAFHLKGSGWYETDFKDKKKETGKTEAAKKEASPQSSTSHTAKTTQPTETAVKAEPVVQKATESKKEE